MGGVPRNLPARRLAGALGLCGGGAVVVALLAPGGPGGDEPVEVGGGVSASVYRAFAEATADVPTWLGSLLWFASDGTVAVLGLLLAWTAWSALRRRDGARVAGAVLAAVGTTAAYAISEALKLVVHQERPCRAVPGAMPLAHCPEAGDWSFPSNHATLAAGFAVGLAILRPALAWLTLPLAAAAAVLRVVVGVHYPHDVLAGATLGTTATAALLLLLLTPRPETPPRPPAAGTEPRKAER